MKWGKVVSGCLLRTAPMLNHRQEEKHFFAIKNFLFFTNAPPGVKNIFGYIQNIDFIIQKDTQLKYKNTK